MMTPDEILRQADEQIASRKSAKKPATASGAQSDDGWRDPWSEAPTPRGLPPSNRTDGQAQQPSSDGFGARLKQGVGRAFDSAQVALSGDEGVIAKVAADQQRNALPQTALQRQMAEEIAPYNEAAKNAEGFADSARAWGALGLKRAGQLLSNPAEAGKMIVEQLPNSIPGLAGGFAGAKAGAALGTAVAPGLGTAVGAAVGGLAGGFAGGYGLEKGASVIEQVQEKAHQQGIDLQDQVAARGFVAKNLAEIDEAATRKAVGTAGTDAVLNVLTMGAAGLSGRGIVNEARALAKAVDDGVVSAADATAALARLEAANAARNTAGQKALRGGAVVGAEMAGEGISEAVGQKYAYGEVDPGQVIDEALLGLGQGGAMALGGKAFRKAAGLPDNDDAATRSLDDVHSALAKNAGLQQDGAPNDGDSGGGGVDAQAGNPAFDSTNTPAPFINQGVMDVNGLGPRPPAPVLDTQRLDALLEPQRPSQAMGLRTGPDAGPLENAAALSVDTGATAQMQGPAGIVANDLQSEPQAATAMQAVNLDEVADPYERAMLQRLYDDHFADGDLESVISANAELDTSFDFGANVNQLLANAGATPQEIEDAQRGQASAQAADRPGQAQENDRGDFDAELSVAKDEGDGSGRLAGAEQGEASQQPVAQQAAAPGSQAEGANVATLAQLNRKKLAEMSDDELQQLSSLLPADHSRQQKIQKAIQTRAAQAQAAINEGVKADGTQADQTQQAIAQPTQAGAAQAGQPAGQGLNNGAAPAENDGRQASAPTAPQAQAQELDRQQRAKRLDDAGAQWTRMPAVQRSALAQRLDGVKPVLAKNMPRAEWGNLNADIQRKLADAMGTTPALDSKANQPQNQEKQAQAATEQQAAPGRQSTESAYTLPSGSISDEWRDDQKRSPEHPDFTPTPRQQRLMDEVKKVLDSGAFYNDDVTDKVAKALGVSDEALASNRTRVQGGDFGYDVYHARQAVQAKALEADAAKIRAELNLRAGDKLGTLIFNDFKQTNSVEVVSVTEDGRRASFKGKRGAATVTFEATVPTVKFAIERAHERGKRKDSYEEFIAGRVADKQAAEQPQNQAQQAQAATETVAPTAQQTNSQQNESENAVGQAQAATNNLPANLQEGEAARGKAQQGQAIKGAARPVLARDGQGFKSEATDAVDAKDATVARPDAQFSPKSEIANSMPTFKGNKSTMLGMAVSAIRNMLTPSNITHVDDWFGGGGMWSTTLALATLPNVKTIRIAELNPLRIQRIQWMHERGDKLFEDMQRTGALRVYRNLLAEFSAATDRKTGLPKPIVSPSPFEKIGLELAGFGGGNGGLARARSESSGALDLSNEGKVLLSALGDLAFNNRGVKIHQPSKLVLPDGTVADQFLAKAITEFALAHAAAQKLKARGVVYQYFPAGSSFDLAPIHAVQGSHVLSLADPPYYNTTGYKGAGSFATGDKWNATGYAATRDLLQTLATKGNNIVYTDEAWWLRPEQMDDAPEADGILAGINNTLSHLMVAPEKVGGRYEQLGIHNPRAAVRGAAGAAAGQSAQGRRNSNQPNTGGRGDVGGTGSEVQGNTTAGRGVGRDVSDTAGRVAAGDGREGGGSTQSGGNGLNTGRTAQDGNGALGSSQGREEAAARKAKPAAQSPIERAKAVGIKGLRADMSDETLRQRVKSYLAGERAARLIAAGKQQADLPQYQGVSEKDARTLGALVESHPYSVNTSGEQWVFDARGVTTADALVQGGLLKPDNGNYKHELTPVGKEIARKALRSPIGDASIGDMLTELEESKPKTGNNGNFDPANQDIRRSFAGQQAATADTMALVTAQQRLEAGEDAETVRQETGWHKGVDGKWRFEISDADAKYIGKDAMEQAAENDPYKMAEMRLEEVLDHPALFAAYPGLRDVSVSYEASSAADGDLYYGASYNAQDNVITIGNGLDEGAQLSALLHEIQHGIQNVEGFATGGGLETAKADVLEGLRTQLYFWANVYSLRREMDAKGITAQEAAAAEAEFTGEEPNADAVQIASDPELQTAVAEQNMQRLEQEIARIRKKGAREVYEAMAGEVEARNTQARQGMTDAQRRATPPSQTADVADNDVIVAFNGKEADSAPAPANAAPDAVPQPTRTPAATIRAAINRAYGKLLGQLEAKGLVTLAQTEAQAIEAAAQARADKTGGDVGAIRAELMASVQNSLSPMKSAEANIRRGLESLAKALDEKTTVHRAMFRNGLGWVDFVWGDTGVVKPSGKTKGAMGIIHIFEARKRKDGMNEAQTIALLEDIVDVIASGEEIRRNEFAGSVTVTLKKGRAEALLTRNPGSNTWMISGWAEKNPDANRAGSVASTATSSAPTTARRGEGAGFAEMIGSNSLDVKRSANGAVQGFFDPQTGQSFLVADNLSAEAAPGVLMHEVGIHMAADGSMKALFNRAATMLKLQKGNPFMKAVHARMDAAGETSGEEAAAYIAEAYENDRANAPASVQRWLADLLAAVKAWMFKKGIMGADRLTVADIAAVARANAKSLARGNAGGGVKFSRTGGTDQTQTENFKRWFGDSQVVDENGKPLVVYHGSRFGGFSVFMRSAGGFIYTTPNADYASRFSGSSDGSAVYPAYVSIKKPLDLTHLGERSMSAEEARVELKRLGVNLDEVQPWEGAPAESVKLYGDGPIWRLIREDRFSIAAKNAGFDGIKINEGDGEVAWVAFEPTQVKSATGNNGQFDPANPDIRYSRMDDNAATEGVSNEQRQTPNGIPAGLPTTSDPDSQYLERRINNWLQTSGWRADRLSAVSLPIELRTALDRFTDATGTRVVLFRNLTPEIEDFNGVNFRDGRVFINETSQHPATLTAAHEWVHNFKRTNPKLYQQLEDEVREQGRIPQWHQRNIKEEGMDRGIDHAIEELTAAAVSDAMTDPAFLEQLALRNQGVFRRVAQAFLDFLDTLTSGWRDQGSNAYLRDVQAFRNKLADVLDRLPIIGQDAANFAANPARRPGSAQDKAVMQAIADGKTTRDVLRLVANGSKDPFLRQVARLLLKAGITPNIQFGHIGKTKKGDPIHGQYRGGSDTILMAGSAEYAAERIFMHEAMHAATMRALAKPGLPRLQLQKLLEHVRKNGGAAGFYGLKNVDEFVAEVFTNPDFQAALRKMNAPSGSSGIKTAWDGFVRILRSILGLKNDPNNALSQALELGVAAVREDMGLRKQGVRAEGAANFGVDDFARNVGEGIKSITATNIKKVGSHKLTDWLKLGLQFLGRRQLTDVYGDLIPQMRDYDRLAAQMEADKNESGAEADELVRRWAKLPDEGKLADLMHEATLAQIDADSDVEYVAGDDKAQSAILKNRFKALSPEAQAVYREARDGYKAHHEKVRKAIRERIERSELSSPKRHELLAKMDDDFFQKVKGVYFPLARFGRYVTAVKDGTGQVVSVSRAETMPEAESARVALLKAFPAENGFSVGRVTLDKEFVASHKMVGRGFMTDLYRSLEGVDLPTDQLAELEDTLGQLYLSSLPDLSWAKHGIHRKGTPGFSQDARRAFAQNMFHGARYLAKLRYSDVMQDSLDAMQEHVDEWGAVTEEFDQPKAQRVVDEMLKRHDAMMNPKSNPLSTAMTSFGFLYYLGLSPASAMVNLSQTALVAYPVMAGKWGYKKTAKALARASTESLAGKNNIRTQLTNKDEIAAYEQAVKAGVIDVTMAHDLAGIAQGEDQKVSWALRPVMRMASYMFHQAELFNRQSTFIAAFRLAREAGSAPADAYEQAVKATYDGHFDYGAANRPRVMQGNVARVVLLFKQYAQNMIFTLARQAYQSVAGKSPEERRQARKVFAGLMTTHAMAAGVLGLPLVGPLLAAASMLGSDDDEPWDAEVALRNMLAEAVGQKPAEVIAKGVSRLTPWDISGRVGLDKLIFPDLREGLEGQRWAETFTTGMLGPVVGIGVNAAKAAQKMGDGDYGRALEDLLPIAARNPIKAARYWFEGAQDRSGVAIKDEVSSAGALGQLVGFSPSEVRLAQEGKTAVMDADRRLNERRAELTGKFAKAAMKQDQTGMDEARQEIAKFNEKNPGRRITAPQLWQSVRRREQRIREAENGVYLPSKRRDAMEFGAFAFE